MKTRIRYTLISTEGPYFDQAQNREVAKRESTVIPRIGEYVRLGKLIYEARWVCHIEDDGPAYVMVGLMPQTLFPNVLLPKGVDVP